MKYQRVHLRRQKLSRDLVLSVDKVFQKEGKGNTPFEASVCFTYLKNRLEAHVVKDHSVVTKNLSLTKSQLGSSEPSSPLGLNLDL